MKGTFKMWLDFTVIHAKIFGDNLGRRSSKDRFLFEI